MGNLISTLERVNMVLKKANVSSIDELAKKSGLSEGYLFKLKKRGLIESATLLHSKRGMPPDTYGPIVENLGIVEMLAYWGYPAKIIAEEIGVSRTAVWEHIRNNQELYGYWKKERKNHDDAAANERIEIFELLSYMGVPRTIMAEVLEINPATTYYNHKSNPELYEMWKRERWKKGSKRLL